MRHALRLGVNAWLALITSTCLNSLALAQDETHGTDSAAPATQATQPAEIRSLSRDIRSLVADTRGQDTDIRALADAARDMAAQDSSISVSEKKDGLRVAILGDVLFDFDQSAIRPKATRTLKQIVPLLGKLPDGNKALIIEGHTDAKGSASYNKKLSLKRAESVRNWLAKQGGEHAVRIQVRGLGAEHPVADNTKADGSDNPEGRQRNRRVEFVFPNTPAR